MLWQKSYYLKKKQGREHLLRSQVVFLVSRKKSYKEMYLFVPKVNKTCENSFLSLPDLEAHILTSYSWKQRIVTVFCFLFSKAFVRHSKLRLSFLKVSFFSSKTCGVRQALSIKIVSWPFVWTPRQGFVVVQKKKSWLKFCFADNIPKELLHQMFFLSLFFSCFEVFF